MTDCCLCGLPYERLGNNPKPLAEAGRCCDACNEIVIEARMPGPSYALAEEIERVEKALAWAPAADLRRMALAAICASRGPGRWASKKAALARLREVP